VIAQAVAEIALEIGAEAVVHGCTGKGNVQLRFELAFKAHYPGVKVIAPLRDRIWTRDEEIEYATAKGIPVVQTVSSPFSIDENFFGRAIEAGVLEDPWAGPPEEPYALTSDPARSPAPIEIVVGFEKGIPVSLDGEELSLADLIAQATSEFGFVRLPESAATGSSMMPQKLNPDVAELVRGKAGTAIGRLTGLLATVKGLPLAYDRDLQEDKAPVFSTRRETRLALEALTVLVSGLEVDRERMAKAASDPLLLATDAAEELVREGVPFRDAHEQVAESVRDGSFKKPRKGAKRASPGPGGIHEALEEARHRFVDNL